MYGRVKAVSGHECITISEHWICASCAPDAVSHPSRLDEIALEWTAASVPCTAASALRTAGRWTLDTEDRRFDAYDWWFRTTFAAPPENGGEQCWLCFDGLATVADVWLNGECILHADGMFTQYEIRADRLRADRNELAIRFRAIDTILAAKRPRPRWRVPMLAHQQLRWVRTTLLGRMPGWSPPAPAVGPWRPIRLERRRSVLVSDVAIRAEANGLLDIAMTVTPVDGGSVAGTSLVLTRGTRREVIVLQPDGQHRFSATTSVPDVEPWWPHTHGSPILYDAIVQAECTSGPVELSLGTIGFRTVRVETVNGDFALSVNGVPVFCRGACWTPVDVVSLNADDAALDAAFAQLRESGMNMLRVGGTMTYESDAFLDRCDANGVLLWQDLMFANMDYPSDDAAFMARIDTEVSQQLARLQGRPSVALICGNSEGSQQAAMWGAARERWASPLFEEHLASLATRALPGVPYWPSSAHGGAFPHQASAGTSSYYGVGAYLRPLDDARRAEVRFASECLAFANVPEPETLERMPGGSGVRVHHAAWKARSPRDLGAGWDFDDVRDHYLAQLYRVDPVALRYADHERYLELGRAATGEVMAAAFLEWRRARSLTRGALVWFLRDLWPGAGWGVLDDAGRPKVAWHYLRRALAPIALGLSDEGGNGIAIHAINDRPEPCVGTIELALYRQGELCTGRGALSIEVAAHAAIEIPAANLFEAFRDLNHAYRFGPPSHELIAATWQGLDGTVVARAFHFVGALPSRAELDIGLAATFGTKNEGSRTITVSTRRFAQTVRISVPGFRCEDDAFHLAPGETRTLSLLPDPASRAVHDRATVRALNCELVTKVGGL